jgi:hypothetical protein
MGQAMDRNGTASAATRETYKRRGFDKNPPLVNCYDQAGFLGLAWSLSFNDEQDREALVCYNMKPFGFIKKPHLVGIDGECDNPFVQYTKDPMVKDPRGPKQRRHFHRHVFLAWDGYIFDACAGPARGTESLKYYPKEVIDDVHPTEVWMKGKKLTEKEITGGMYDAKPYQSADEHRGILGELENMMKAENGSFDLPPT